MRDAANGNPGFVFEATVKLGGLCFLFRIS